MARFVTVAAVNVSKMYKRHVKDKPNGVSYLDFVLEGLKSEINKVLLYKPDLIVLPEFSNSLYGMDIREEYEYFKSTEAEFVSKIGEIAAQNNCYIAFGAWRMADDGYGRNSCIMLDRHGQLVGYYDKNYPTPPEYDLYHTLHGRDGAIFECDFGRVGALICFDMNFPELREKYKKLRPELLVFPSMYNGGSVRNFYAIDCRCFIAASTVFPCEIISPLGVSVHSETGYYSYAVATINLDYAICHLDYNRPRFEAAKKKYGKDFVLTEPGGLGFVMISYEGTDKTIKDIIKEFEIEEYDEYLDRSREKHEIMEKYYER